MSQIEFIFLDDGGVLNDNSLRGPEWQRLVGEFFVPRLGGTHAQWSAANQRTLAGVFERMTARWQGWDETTDDYTQACEESDRDWLRSMCAHVGVPPPDDASLLRLAREASAYIEPRVQANFPGVVETLNLLAAKHVLFMASTGPSWELDLRLTATGVRNLFRRLYGPDLINVPKLGRRYYQRLFEHAGVDPARSLVVDDKPEFLDHAASLGAHTVLVGTDESPVDHTRVSALANLQALLNNLTPLAADAYTAGGG